METTRATKSTTTKAKSTTRATTPAQRASRIPGSADAGRGAKSKDARSEITTRDDGSFVRTAIVLRSGEKTGSIDLVDEAGAVVAQINMMWMPSDPAAHLDRKPGEENLIVDVIDVSRRFTKLRAIGFSTTARADLDVPKGGRLVSVDFAK